MVRVISVHHFASQHIQSVEQPTACTVAPPDKLLLALTSNCIEVRDLSNESDLLFTFPSVDEVIQIVHCKNGDFVATMETKFNRQNKETNFVRVYVNWDSVAAMQQSKMTNSGISLGSSECGMVQPMRARIAGRVTPTTNQSELGSLEMIEIPVKRNPNRIACCQISGNLLLASNRIVNIYRFQVRTHDISKMKFVDFDEMPVGIELPFAPCHIDMCENFISCMNKDNMYLFKMSDKIDDHREITTDNGFDFRSQESVDYAKLITDELLDLGKVKVTVNLPSIVRDNSIIHKNSPFTFTDKDMTARIRQESLGDVKMQNFHITHLIQLKLVSILVESAQRQITEEFKCMLLKPLYVDEHLNKTTHQTTILSSDYRKHLNSVVCIIATQQEGYLYYFNESGLNDEADNCVAVYPFTAPVQQIVVDDHFLHALTETGLESYTLRFGHKLCRTIEPVDGITVACPLVTDSICLVGLRPFLGVEQILLSDHHLVLLANSDTSPTHSVSSSSSSNASYWTLYNLELPTAKTVFNDISIVASVHRFSSIQTYCHLMSEAHMILRMTLVLKQWSVNNDDSVKLVAIVAANQDDLIDCYRISCALLGDHYIMCPNANDFALALPYYKMAKVSPFEVLKKVKRIQEQSNNHSTKGLVFYLKKVLVEIRHNFDGGSKQNFAEAILDLFASRHNYDDLPHLILKSAILREYSTDKLIQILSERSSDHVGRTENYLALAILHIQKCNQAKAFECLQEIPRDNLRNILLDNWELLFDSSNGFQGKKTITTFSELAVILIGVHPDLLSTLIVSLIVQTKVLTLNKTIKIFLEYLPSSIGSDSNSASLVLQKTLEMYFEQYIAKIGKSQMTQIIYERGANEALKLLVRSYLSQLQIYQLKEDVTSSKEDVMKSSFSKLEKEILSDSSEMRTYFEEKSERIETYLFGDFRYDYLDKMSPFQIEITSKLYEACVDDYMAKPDHRPNDEADFVLKKLQAILCSQIVSKHVIGEVNGFLSLNDNIRGSLSLQSIIMATNDAVLLLIEACPQCLLQFGKDRFTRTDEWKFLIATVQRRILRLSQNDVLKRICFFHKKILKDILTYVAMVMSLDQLVQVFPQRFSSESSDTNRNYDDLTNLENDLDILNEIQNYEPYVMICKETMHANQINKLITATGQQLLCTLNL